ncbi:nucleosome assembly protein 1-like 1-B [Daphnia pulex]|uniref:nucleosome assembly protein 1-like 1-B n=1 Tax=Daphnia pulex TaxID=6669 RepID=UPI001EDE1475|nr:nucleosome assembly protein 1-like 1-B [Daphnia pulex]
MESDKAAIVENSEEDIEEVEEEEEGSDKLSKEKLQAAVLQNPRVMAACSCCTCLDSMVGDPSGYIKSLPVAVQRRIKALKNLQLETTKIEAEFFKEVHVLECKYQTKYQSFFEKRAKITSGELEPTDEDCVWTLDDDKESEELTFEGETKEEDDFDEEEEEEEGDEDKNIRRYLTWRSRLTYIEAVLIVLKLYLILSGNYYA